MGQIHFAPLSSCHQTERGHQDDSWHSGHTQQVSDLALGQLSKIFAQVNTNNTHAHTNLPLSTARQLAGKSLVILIKPYCCHTYKTSVIVLLTPYFPIFPSDRATARNTRLLAELLAEQQLRACGRDVQPWPTLKENAKTQPKVGDLNFSRTIGKRVLAQAATL